MLWHRRDTVLRDLPQLGITGAVDLSSEASRQALMNDRIKSMKRASAERRETNSPISWLRLLASIIRN
jgi:hypothetical protein